ncbi:MAG: low molecular weight protein-tyrosine-phosphatase [Bdellovibrionota bacterium]
MSTNPSTPKKVLFVCLGNICRSPTAHGVFDFMVKEKNMDHVLSCDSAGTADYHVGSLPDLRSREHAKKRGYTLDSLSRAFNPERDFDEFDLILTMDENNLRNVLARARNLHDEKKVIPFTYFCKAYPIRNVPDPYYKGDQGFEEVLDIIEDGCTHLIQHLTQSESTNH